MDSAGVTNKNKRDSGDAIVPIRHLPPSDTAAEKLTPALGLRHADCIIALKQRWQPDSQAARQ
jgi:hypothetical protein